MVSYRVIYLVVLHYGSIDMFTKLEGHSFKVYNPDNSGSW